MPQTTHASSDALTRELARRLTFVTAAAWNLPPPAGRVGRRGNGRVVALPAGACVPSMALRLCVASF